MAAQALSAGSSAAFVDACSLAAVDAADVHFEASVSGRGVVDGGQRAGVDECAAAEGLCSHSAALRACLAASVGAALH